MAEIVMSTGRVPLSKFTTWLGPSLAVCRMEARVSFRLCLGHVLMRDVLSKSKDLLKSAIPFLPDLFETSPPIDRPPPKLLAELHDGRR